MAITGEREIARADMNDGYGVAVWQERKLVDYSVDEARALAAEILAAAGEAERVEREDSDAAFESEGVSCHHLVLRATSGEVVL